MDPSDVKIQDCRGWSPVQLLGITRLGDVIGWPLIGVQMSAGGGRLNTQQNLQFNFVSFTFFPFQNFVISLSTTWPRPGGINSS